MPQALIEAPLPPTDRDENRTSGPIAPLSSRNAPSNNCAGSSQGDFLRVGLSQRHAKSPKAFVEGLTDAACYTAKWLKSS